MELFTSPTGQPIIRRSLCAFLDLLGFRERTVAAADQQTILDRYLAVVSPPTELAHHSAEFVGTWRVASFSDSLILGYPLQNEHPAADFSTLHPRLADYQFRLAQFGWFVRGGLTVGPLFMNERLTFGSAFIKAHHLEQSAVDPRIILAPDLAKSLAEPRWQAFLASPLTHPPALLVDTDGQVFLNYLNAAFLPRRLDEAALLRHKTGIEQALVEFRQQPHIWCKYRWLAEYHNYFVSLHASKLSSSLHIGTYERHFGDLLNP